MKRHTLSGIFAILVVVPTVMWGQPKFTDVTQEAGINHFFEVFEGTFGGGVAVLDYNLDGWEDLFLAGGGREKTNCSKTRVMEPLKM